MIYDLVFSEGLFAEAATRQSHLPELMLLRHWRDGNDVMRQRRPSPQILIRGFAMPRFKVGIAATSAPPRKSRD